MTTGVTPDVETLRREVQKEYTTLATNPDGTYHFNHGRHLAEILGYPMERVDAMPPEAVAVFSGLGNPFSLGSIAPGEKVLDVGSGGGFDSFIAAQAVGPSGKVIGLDMTDAMLERSRALAQEMGLVQVEFRQGFIEQMPLTDAEVDVAISNGVINLCPDKYRAFQEIFRVLRPGGRLYLADIVAYKPIPDEAKADVDLWTA